MLAYTFEFSTPTTACGLETATGTATTLCHTDPYAQARSGRKKTKQQCFARPGVWGLHSKDVIVLLSIFFLLLATSSVKS